MSFLVHLNNTNETENAVVLDIIDIFGKFHIGLKDMNATLNVLEASQAGITVRNSTIGNLTDAVA